MLKIEIAGGSSSFKPGESVEVIAAWELDDEPEAIEARLLWYTEGKGTQDISVVQTERVERPGKLDGKRFRWTLPEAPYSFSGKLISLLWAVELVAIPTSESTRINIVIAPEGNEVILHAGGGDDS